MPGAQVIGASPFRPCALPLPASGCRGGTRSCCCACRALSATRTGSAGWQPPAPRTFGQAARQLQGIGSRQRHRTRSHAPRRAPSPRSGGLPVAQSRCCFRVKAFVCVISPGATPARRSLQPCIKCGPRCRIINFPGLGWKMSRTQRQDKEQVPEGVLLQHEEDLLSPHGQAVATANVAFGGLVAIRVSSRSKTSAVLISLLP